MENFHVLPSSLRSWLWKYNNSPPHHCFKVNGGSVKYPPCPFVWGCNIILSVTGMQENHKQAKSKSTVPLTIQYNIPTEVAIVYHIIKKSSFNGKVQSQIQLQELSMEKISVRNSSWFTQLSQVVFAGRC